MNVKIKFLPYERFVEYGFRPLIKALKENTIVMIDAKLSAEQEAYIIEETMKGITDQFKGIELSSIDLMKKKNITSFMKFKNVLIEAIIGKKRGLTIIGNAQIVHKIKKNPEELLLYL